MLTKKFLSVFWVKIAQKTQDPRRVAEDLSTAGASSLLVMAGAGLSTASGIPDFRSPGSGLYDNLARFRLPYPEAIFDIDYFKWGYYYVDPIWSIFRCSSFTN